MPEHPKEPGWTPATSSKLRETLMTEPAFDDAVRLATTISKAEYAAITLAGIDRLWFAATSGFVAEHTLREGSFCERTIETGSAFVVPDALLHPELRDARFVTGELRLRYYFGMPLTARDGSVIGTLCIGSRRPNLELGDRQRSDLELLASMTVDRAETRIAACSASRDLRGMTDLAAAIVSEAVSLATESATTDQTALRHALAVDAAAQGFRQVILLDREMHDGLIGQGRPARGPRRIAGLPDAVDGQIDLHQSMTIALEEEIDLVVGGSAALRSRTSGLERQGQRLVELACLLEDRLEARVRE